MPHDPSNHDAEPGLPESLRQQLRDLYEPPAGVARSPSTDDAILREARARAAAIRHRRKLVRTGLWAGWGSIAAAAAIGIAVTLFGPAAGPPAFQPGPLPQAAGPAVMDINGDGVVDILDALKLAIMIREGPAPDQSFDFTGSGVVDQADVDAIAATAVKLDQGERG